MRIAEQLMRGNWQRKTRAHTEKGDFGIRSPRDVADLGRSLRGALRRKLDGKLPVLPWLTYPAIRYLDEHLPHDAKVFEFGGGMSTAWYTQRCGEVWTVDRIDGWYQKIKKIAPRAQVELLQGEAYYRRIEDFPKGHFDLAVIDGAYRFEAFFAACDRVKKNGWIVVDDTDKGRTKEYLLRQLDEWLGSCREFEVMRFVGWVPGSFWVKETTVARKLTDQSSHAFRPEPRPGWC